MLKKTPVRALVVCFATSFFASGALAGVDATWDWTNGARKLHLVPDGRMGYDPQAVMVAFDVADGAAATMWDATKMAADAWNHANMAAGNNWMITYGGAAPAGSITITVGMGALQLVGMDPPFDGNGVRRFKMPPSVGAPADGGTDGQGGWGGGAGASDALGFFTPKNGPVNMQFGAGDIRYNPNASWATDLSPAKFNPVLLAFHELGHAMKLDHGGDGQQTATAMNAAGLYLGSVMRPKMDTVIGMVNPFNDNTGKLWRYYPDQIDIGDATNSDKMVVPAPGAIGAMLIGGLVAIRRRR